MYEFLYYLTLPFVIVSASMVSFYILYPNESKKQFMKVTWNATRLMVECNDVMDSLKNSFNGNSSDSESDSDTDSDSSEDNEYNEVIVYDHDRKRDFSSTTDEIDDERDHILNNKNIKLVLYHRMKDDDEYYKRIDNIKDFDSVNDDSNVEIETIEKQFIQVEYITEDNDGNEKIIDIHSNLGDFYVKGNTILDKYFLGWYLENFYDIEVDEDYKLRFFDKDVNMFTLSTNNAIMFSDKTYSKIDINDNTFLIKDEDYEGAEDSNSEE